MEAEEVVEGALTVHRKVNGSTTDPISGSARTKLEPPRTGVLALPKLQPLRTPGTDGILLWYSFRHNLNDDAHGGQPGRAGERLIMQKKTVSCWSVVAEETHLWSRSPSSAAGGRNTCPIIKSFWDWKFLESAAQSFRMRAPPGEDKKSTC